MDATLTMHDVELRLVDPTRNRFRLYSLTECRTLFDEFALIVAWGRIGSRLRTRTEVFETREARERRRLELVGRRRRHGYVSRGEGDAPVVAPATARARKANADTPLLGVAAAASLDHAIEREIVEAHGLRLVNPTARTLVARWHAATRELARYLDVGRRREPFDLVDVSTLASMYVAARGAA